LVLRKRVVMGVRVEGWGVEERTAVAREEQEVG
jgi:hypothetical protein